MNLNALKIAKERECATPRTEHIPILKVTAESAYTLLRPIARHKVNNTDFQFVINVLEQVPSISEKRLSNYIANDIVPFVEDVDYSAKLINQSNITTKSVLETALQDTIIASRILKNKAQLEKRFNFKQIISESSTRDEEDTIISLCEMIDTYTMKPHIKLNIALENITYGLYMANQNLSIVPDTVLEYFLFRDSQISDQNYLNYQKILSDNHIFSPSDFSAIYEFVIDKDPYEFNQQIASLFKSVGIDNKNNMAEQDILNTLDDINMNIQKSYLDDDERSVIYQAIHLFPLAYDVPKDFMDVEISKRFDKNDIDNCIKNKSYTVERVQGIPFSKTLKSLNEDQIMHIFDESSTEIADLLNEFKAEQDKSMSKFRLLLNKIHAKKPEDIIDGLPNIFNVVRAIFIIGTATITPVGPVIASTLSIIDFLLNRKINEDQCEKLLEKLRSERSKVIKKINTTTNEKKKKDLEAYEKSLMKSIDKVKEYADSLSTDDHDDDRDMDSPDNNDDDFDFDFGSLESEIMSNTTALNTLFLVESNIDFYLKSISIEFNKELHKTICTLTENNLLPQFIEVAKYSNISIDNINTSMNIIESACGGKPIITTALASAKNIISSERFNFNQFQQLIATNISNSLVNTVMNEVAINEKVNLNAMKLALQNAKSKIKQLGAKEKSMWQSVDAHASGFTKSVEKALTSDRREAIIKGSVIPSFSKCIKGSLALAGVGIMFGPMTAAITAFGAFATSKLLNEKEKRLLYDEIETELKVVEKQIDIAQNDGDMNQYRFLLNYQKKLTREHQRIKYGLKVSGRDIPSATRPEE